MRKNRYPRPKKDYHGCVRKRAFLSFETAMTFIERIRRHYGRRFDEQRAYMCPDCGMVHLSKVRTK